MASVIKIDDSAVKELRGTFSSFLPRELERAKRSALSKVRTGTKQRMSTWIRERGRVNYNVKAARVKNGIRLTKIRNDQFQLIASNKPISLTSFPRTTDLGAKHRRQKGKGRRTAYRSGKAGPGVAVTIRKGRRVRILSAFIARSTRNGAEQVFRRVRKGGVTVNRYPLKTLKGPSISNMILVSDAHEDLADFTQDRFDAELVRALRGALFRKRR